AGSRAAAGGPRGSIRRPTPAAGLDTQMASGPAATDSAPWPTRTVVTTFLPSSSTRYRTPPYGSTAHAAPWETTSELRLIAGTAIRRFTTAFLSIRVMAGPASTTQAPLGSSAIAPASTSVTVPITELCTGSIPD